MIGEEADEVKSSNAFSSEAGDVKFESKSGRGDDQDIVSSDSDSFNRQATLQDSEFNRYEPGSITIIKQGDDQYYGIETPTRKT